MVREPGPVRFAETPPVMRRAGPGRPSCAVHPLHVLASAWNELGGAHGASVPALARSCHRRPLGASARVAYLARAQVAGTAGECIQREAIGLRVVVEVRSACVTPCPQIG